MLSLFNRIIKLTVFLSLVIFSVPQLVWATDAVQIDREVQTALKTLYADSAVAKELAAEAKGILIFPDVIKAGIILGAHYGEGALLQNGETTGYYSTVAVSYGLQVGAQTFGYALIFMTDKDLDYLKSSSGWEVGVGPSIVVVDSGVAKALTTTTARDNVYAFFFDQKGLMAGLGLQGSKITRITPDQN